MDQDLFALLQQADPETIQQMIDAGLVPAQMGVQQQAGAMGQGLAQTPSPQGREVGKTYVASSPLEHLSAALRQGVGMGMERGAMGQQNDLIGKQGAGRLAYLRLLAGNGQQPQPGAVQAPEDMQMYGPPSPF